jgi:hypothetical protein
MINRDRQIDRVKIRQRYRERDRDTERERQRYTQREKKTVRDTEENIRKNKQIILTGKTTSVSNHNIKATFTLPRILWPLQ